MRSVINISLPPELKKEVERAVKEGGYASKSEFFRDLLRAWLEVGGGYKRQTETKTRKVNVLSLK